ncbi:MAG: hypothetical protein ABSF45_26485 [Terriglobia bacterium]|jgi:hypothetical protein
MKACTLLLLAVLASSLRLAGETLTLRTRQAAFSIDATGALSAITAHGRNYLAPGQPAPVLSVRVGGKLHPPNRAAWDATRNTLTLDYDGIGATAVVMVRAKPAHLTLELTELRTTSQVELVLWGPYPIAIDDLVGEVVGVVRDSKFAVGIQALNAKTLGGYPSEESDIEPDGLVTDDHGSYPGLPPELRKQQLWRGDTAKRTPFGSTLQAYCRNRDRQRVINNWGHERFVALPFDDGGVIGSKIALFAVPATEALPTIGEIEVTEGLPHPMLDGTWAKMAPGATASYLIVDFGESTIARAIEMTQRAGLKYLYQGSPFETWGHFKLKPDLFPHGWDGFRDCVEKARQAGIGVGFHTLSNFITPNDPYVTPIPDPRLARIGTSELTADVDAAETEIPVADPIWFQKKTDMNTAVIGEELVRYDSVSAEAPWHLLKCQRGAWGTRAAAHRKGDAAGKLMDHSYKVFLTDAALSQEVARHIAAFCNYTGAIQLSLDGLEGNWSTGMGQYGRTLFTQAWYDALKPELRGRVINDASNPGHFNWHIATRYNWGEPWYAGFRQSQTLYRLKNQLFYTRNLIPHMLGWFAVRAETTPEDAEWLCARAAGYDAGFALAASFDSKATQSSSDVGGIDKKQAAIFDVINQWETARQSDAFPESVKPALQDVNQEFHLTPVGSGEWELQPVKPAGPAVRIKARPRFAGSVVIRPE